MNKILYEAISAQGEKVTSFIECDSNANALKKLKEEGYSDIKLHGDALISTEKEYLDGKTAQEVAQIAKYELAIRLQGSKLSRHLIRVFETDRRLLSCFLLLFILGFFTPYYGLSIFVLFSFISYVFRAIRKYKIPDAYQDALKAHALGDHQLFFKSKRFLQQHVSKPLINLDLDGRAATIYASDGRIDEAVALLEKWRDYTETNSPGMLESRLASVYHKTENFKKVIDLRTLAYEKSNHNQTYALDLAMVEVRYGDHHKAEQLLAGIRLEELQTIGLPFYNWILGLLEYKKNSHLAEATLSSALSSMLLTRTDKPASWIVLAHCIGEYAMYAESEQSKKRSEELLSKYWKVLRVHGEKAMVVNLREKYPALKLA
ncbi:MAG: hypothetical protein KGO49_08705 [Gammaproteobacteria bacterium]|nr:hypothetical protein [Gammaproteobacteria bacterium]